MEVTDQEKDLGVLISDTLLWSDHVKKGISKANQMIGWITRNFILREKSVMIRIYKALIRHLIEYCVPVWSPQPEHGSWSLILELEGVQRRFTRLIDGMGQLPYSERLGALNLTTLAERRIRGDLIETFKACKEFSSLGHIFNDGRSRMNLKSNFSSNFNVSSKVNKLKRNFLTERVIKYWNKLPLEVKDSESVNSFKSRLQYFKEDCISKGLTSESYFWNVSYLVIDKIESPSYLENRIKHLEYIKDKPLVAKKQFINLRN